MESNRLDVVIEYHDGRTHSYHRMHRRTAIALWHEYCDAMLDDGEIDTAKVFEYVDGEKCSVIKAEQTW